MYLYVFNASSIKQYNVLLHENGSIVRIHFTYYMYIAFLIFSSCKHHMPVST